MLPQCTPIPTSTLQRALSQNGGPEEAALPRPQDVPRGSDHADGVSAWWVHGFCEKIRVRVSSFQRFQYPLNETIVLKYVRDPSVT